MSTLTRFLTQALILSPPRPPECQTFQAARYRHELALTGKPAIVVDWASPFSLGESDDTPHGRVKTGTEASEDSARWVSDALDPPFIVGVLMCQSIGTHGNDWWFPAGGMKRTYPRDDGAAFEARASIMRRVHAEVLKIVTAPRGQSWAGDTAAQTESTRKKLSEDNHPALAEDHYLGDEISAFCFSRKFNKLYFQYFQINTDTIQKSAPSFRQLLPPGAPSSAWAGIARRQHEGRIDPCKPSLSVAPRALPLHHRSSTGSASRCGQRELSRNSYSPTSSSPWPNSAGATQRARDPLGRIATGPNAPSSGASANSAQSNAIERKMLRKKVLDCKTNLTTR